MALIYWTISTSGLEAAILETQKVLRSAVNRSQNGDQALSSLSSTDGEYRLNVDNTRNKLENLVSKGMGTKNV